MHVADCRDSDAQGGAAPGDWFTVQDFTNQDGTLRRPFATYPHDWRAIQICSGRLAERLRPASGLRGTGGAVLADDPSWFSPPVERVPLEPVPEEDTDPGLTPSPPT